MSREEILAAIPHRDPFLLVDEIVEREERRIVCRKTFSPDEPFYRGHYPHFPVTPGVLLCEASMQAGAILLAPFVEQQEAGVPVATRANNIRFKQMVRPGDTITIEVQLEERLADAFFLKAHVKCQGKTAARLDFACAMVPLPED